MAKVSGVIGVPTFGTISIHFYLARFGLSMPLAMTWVDKVVIGKPIDKARNEIVQYAIDIGADWIFFADDDVIYPPNTLNQLYNRAMNNPDVDMITGVYWSKAHPPQPLLFRGHMEGPYMDWHVGDFIKIDAAGVGCTFIKTKVFKEMKKKFPNDPWFSLDYNVYDTNITNENGMTEDIYFYAKAKQAGFQLWADTSIQCLHYDKQSNGFFGLPSDYPQAIPGHEIKKNENNLKIADLGCGEQTPYFEEGDPVRIDIREEVHPDIVADITNMHGAVPDNEFDIVYASHVLEHFSHAKVANVLKEWTRILKPGGEMRIIVPNVEEAAQNFIDGNISDYDMWVFYGKQDYQTNFHGIGFTEKLLAKLFEQSGLFESVEVKKEFYTDGKHSDLHLRAIKKNLGTGYRESIHPLITGRKTLTPRKGEGEVTPDYYNEPNPVEKTNPADLVKQFPGVENYKMKKKLVVAKPDPVEAKS